MPDVRCIDPASDRAHEIVTQMAAAVDRITAHHGAAIAGFALVAWDLNGDCSSAMLCRAGPIGYPLAPTLVHDALNRHEAIRRANPDAMGWLDD